MGDPWGRGADYSVVTGQRERERRRERERERAELCVPYVEKRHSSAHTHGPLCSGDYPFRSDGGHAGMNR